MTEKTKKTLNFKNIPIVLHPFNDSVENFIKINGVILQNISLPSFGQMNVTNVLTKSILFDFLQVFRPWNDEESKKVEKILSYYKLMCNRDKHFNTKCLFIGNPQKIREIMRITDCPSRMIMLAETLEAAALMTKLSKN